MASQTLQREDVFPVGTSVSAYKRSNWPQSQLPPSGAPVGSADATAAVQSNGIVTLSGLADGTDYYAYAASPHRYVSFRTPAAAASSSAAPANTDRITSLSMPGAISATMRRTEVQSAAVTAPTSGTLRLHGFVVLPAGQAITSINVVAGTTAAATSTHCWFCLVRQSDLSVLAKTVDDTAAAPMAGNRLKTLALSSPFTPSVETLAYIGILLTATTMPTLVGATNVAAAVSMGGDVPNLSANSTTGLTDPASLGATAAALSNVTAVALGWVS